MARLRSEQDGEREPESGGGQPGTLQDAERTGKMAEPKLVDEREREHRIDGNQRQSVEELRHVTRHAKPP